MASPWRAGRLHAPGAQGLVVTASIVIVLGPAVRVTAKRWNQITGIAAPLSPLWGSCPDRDPTLAGKLPGLLPERGRQAPVLAADDTAGTAGEDELVEQ